MISLETMFGGRTYVIPKNQRGYSWTSKEINDLFSDLELMGDKSHYLGTVICTRDVSFIDGISRRPTFKYILEDGQQRLTTFLILINEIRKQFLEMDGKETLDTEYLMNLIKYKNGDTGIENIRIENENILLQECLSHYILGKPALSPEKTPPMRCIENAQLFIRGKIKDIVIREKLVELKNKVCNQVQLIDVDLADARVDRYLTFDAINSRGLPLTEFDKIKNFCILICEKRGLDCSPEDKWYSAISNLEKFQVSSRTNENAFIAELYSIYHCVNVPTNDVHDHFVKEYRLLLEGNNPQIEILFKGFIDYWVQYSEAYGFINSRNKNKYYGNLCSTEAGRWLDSLDNLGLQGVTKRVITASYLLNYKFSEDFEKICRLCEIYTFRMHALCRFRVDKNSKNILELANQILRNGRGYEYVTSKIGGLLEENGTLKDSIEKLASGELNYNSWRNNLYYFLYEYELSKCSKNVKPLPWANADEKKKDSMEHILPQNSRDAGWWQQHWPDQLIADKFYNRLGNIVLTNGNSILKRKPISLKLHDENCDYSYNHKKATNTEKEIQKYTDGSTWKEINILKRELDMINFAIERWSLPFINDNCIINLPDVFKKNVPQCEDIVVQFKDAHSISTDEHSPASEVEFD
ncbi:DUF262 domain-containing protein [Enterobacter kobei]|jgi:hypothetical protein|uniref:DUF262 domain-containing protein n=1 Tax=Enterobacter kobei TaxID=208224 RepID=UPI002FD32376